MHFGPATYLLGLLAGSLSTLSPCVLPILPILLTSAANAHRRGVWGLALGLALSFTLVGMSLATVGFALGFDAAGLRLAAAVILIVLGTVLLSATLQQRFAAATAGIGNGGARLLQRFKPEGLGGQFMVGLLLGIVWSPCVGPTLGAASTLAAQGRHLSQVALLMLLFGLGAAAPLVLLGSLSRATMLGLRQRLAQTGTLGKYLLGVVLILLGLLIVSGWDKPLEGLLVDLSPDWLTVLSTRY